MKYLRHTMTAALAAVGVAATISSYATTGNPINAGSAEKYTLSLIGDVPYGDHKITNFPTFVDFINSDPKVDAVVHVGDIKNGSTLCSDIYFDFVRAQFDRFKDPLIYTPGDNEWTDCHRANNGKYLPAERLMKLRQLFFPVPGETLGGRKKQVLTEASDPNFSDFVENVLWMESRTVFVTLNVPGSNDDNLGTNPWGAPWNTPDFKTLQSEEQSTRDAANAAWLDKAFDTATANNAAALAIFLQADMWDTTAALNAFDPLVVQIGNRALAFGKPVLLVVGDSHVYTVDNPYSAASPLHGVHPGTPIVPNITRIILQGSTTAPNEFEYVRLTVDPRSKGIFSWERVKQQIP
jgi:hypothetical protein